MEYNNYYPQMVRIFIEYGVFVFMNTVLECRQISGRVK